MDIKFKSAKVTHADGSEYLVNRHKEVFKNGVKLSNDEAAAYLLEYHPKCLLSRENLDIKT